MAPRETFITFTVQPRGDYWFVIGTTETGASRPVGAYPTKQEAQAAAQR